MYISQLPLQSAVPPLSLLILGANLEDRGACSSKKLKCSGELSEKAWKCFSWKGLLSALLPGAVTLNVSKDDVLFSFYLLLLQESELCEVQVAFGV